MGSILQRTCLKSTNSLRTQLLLSFGTSSFAFLSIIVLFACTAAYFSGEAVKEQADQLMRGQVTDNLYTASRLVSEQFDAYMMDLEGTVQLIAEAVKDRIVGYPYDGWEEDVYVPFLDMGPDGTDRDRGRRVYPLNQPPPPLDWEINPRTSLDDIRNRSYVQDSEDEDERGSQRSSHPLLTTATGVYFMQGSCDPLDKDPNSTAYYANCTEENNNVDTGGKIKPTSTNRGLYNKSGDLIVFLKALWESQEDVLSVGVFFHNSGAGSHVVFPGLVWPGVPDFPPYESMGCDWMKRINGFTGKPYATAAEIKNCHPKGTLVPQREYNAMERAWCQDFALNPSRIGWYGPYQSFDHGVPAMTIGRSIYDRRTGSFIGCVGIDISVHELHATMANSVLNKFSELLLVGYEDGYVVGDSTHYNTHIKDRHSASFSIQSTGLLEMDTYINAFQKAVDFNLPWTPSEAEQAFRKILPTKNGGLMAAYPVPVIPTSYNKYYKPRFMILHSIDQGVFDVVADINDSIDEDVHQIYILATGLAVFGMIVVLSIVWCVSRMLTQPLNWIKNIAWRIVNHADKYTSDSFHMPEQEETKEGKFATLWFAPRTEINQLVAEFRTMIKGFSGAGASKVADPALHEIRNELTWHSDFQLLYSKYRRKAYRSGSITASGSITNLDVSVSNIDISDEESSCVSSGRPTGILQRPLKNDVIRDSNEAVSLIVPAPVKRNRNCVIHSTRTIPDNESQQSVQFVEICRSPLFWWIVILILIPLLLLICLICAVVSSDIVDRFPKWIESADDASYDLAISALSLTARSKASLMTAVVFEAVRDLHLMTRVAGWLFFGGIQRSTSFTEMDTSTEECKFFSVGTCPYYQSDRVPCPCNWNDLIIENCTAFNHSEARDLQVQFWAGQSQDADLATGRRVKSSSFPTFGSTPNTTQWWGDVTSLPGFNNASQISGYNTSYDRLRVSSAMSVVNFPVYNYASSMNKENRILGVFLGFEDDGLFTGFKGCRYTSADYSFWQSNDDNLAAEIAPSLCPYGKFGFDPRCRDWYATGKKKYMTSNRSLHVTAPYKFAIDTAIATSGTSPIVNPKTGRYVGQTLLDFFPNIEAGLEQLGDNILPILITPEADAAGGDTVIGPNATAGSESRPVLEVLFKFDAPGSENRIFFESSILSAMKNGSYGKGNFQRRTQTGSTERLTISYAPVWERVLLPDSPDNFTAGVIHDRVLLYSVGVIRTPEDMHEPFHLVEDDIRGQLDQISTIYVSVTIAAALLFTAFTCIVTLFIVTPVITLLHVVQNINKRMIEDDLPPLQGGSREVHRVYSTFAKLYKIVRVSNTAFFSGNLKWAYHFVNDALQLFRKINDQKAVGIACNNLGNTLFAVYYDAVEDIGLDTDGEGSLIPVALRHYEEAIQLGEADFEATPESELKAEYALQLADRLFNRGLFLLLIDGDEMSPENARLQAFADIRRARNLDYDVKDYMLVNKILLKNSCSYFTRLIRRINGLADFYDDVGLQDVWNVMELVDDADQLLLAAWNEPSAPLFHAISRVGRLQQLEAAAISLYLRMENKIEAARLAMRCFSEDEFLLEASFARAADALLQVMRSDFEVIPFSKKTISCVRDDLRCMLKSCKNASLDIGKCLVFAVELSQRWENDSIMEHINENCLSLYDRHCSSNDYMGLVAYSTKESFTVEIGMKEGNEGRQRTMLDIATSSTTEVPSPAFQIAIQMIVDGEASLENDSFVVLLLDGSAWNTEASSSLRLQLDRLNRERNTSIHVILLGLGIEDKNLKDQLRQMCSVSKFSMYADIEEETIDGIFDLIATAIAGRPLNNGFLKGVTMERF